MMEIADPLFREAIAAIDAGDIATLERLLAANPRLVRDRTANDEHAYFRDPYLLWFVAENPVRNDRLPANIAEVTRAILRAARDVETLPQQLDYALALVCSGRVPREAGVQRELIDVLVDAGANPDSAMLPALAHREADAVDRLLERGAAQTLVTTIAAKRNDDAKRLAREANAEERQLGLAAAAFYGNAEAIAVLLELGADVNAYCPANFHQHATPLHHAIDNGSLESVRMLIDAGANLDTKDLIYKATPLGWAEYLGRPEIVAYLRGRDGAGL